MIIEISRQLKNQAMLCALRVKDGRTFFRVQTTQCAVLCKGKQTGLRNNTNSVQNSFYYYFFELLSPFCEIRHKLNKQNLQRQSLESLYAQIFSPRLTVINATAISVRPLVHREPLLAGQNNGSRPFKTLNMRGRIKR